MEIRMVDLRNQYENIKEEMDSAIQKVLESTSFIKGPFVNEFCKNLSSYLDSKYVIPCGNGTDALQLALMALDLQAGDEIITTPFTFVATAETIVLLGLKPVFVDVDERTFNIDTNKIEEAITSKTKCIIPVHLFGQSCDMDAIMTIARSHNLNVIEDTAQSIGAYYNYNGIKHMCSTIAKIGTFSFFPSKNLGAYGDGGAVCTSDPILADKINLYANHGSSRKYFYDNIGINSRLDALQAAILDVKLKYLDDYNKSRIAAADYYDDQLRNVEGIKTPFRALNRNHVFHQYTLTLSSNRDKVQSFLKEKGIPTGIYYPAPLHTQSIYQEYAKKGGYPVSESLSNSVLSLPMHSELNENMQNYIVDSLKQALLEC